MDVDTEFYRKLNEYYTIRSEIYSKSGYRKITPIFENILIFSIIFLITFFGGIIMSFFYSFCFIISAFSLVILIPIISLIIKRKKLFILIDDFQINLKEMRNEYSPIFDQSKIDVADYINDYRELGYQISMQKIKSKTIYLIKKDNVELKIITYIGFFKLNCYCYINGKRFEKINEDVSDLKRCILDYKENRLRGDFYGKIGLFYKYTLLKY